MNRRVFVLLILILLVGAIAVVLFFVTQSGGGIQSLLGGGGPETTPAAQDGGEGEPGMPAPTATPALRLRPVVVSNNDLPAGTRLTADLLESEERPDTNVAIVGQYTFSDTQDLVGQIIRVNVAEGQEILRPMLALNPTDLAAMGSDLALYVNQGRVAVAFPINRYSGAAFAMRPGDLVDIFMTARIVEVDPEFRTSLPNTTRRVIESQLLEGQQFLFPEVPKGRLEFIEAIGQVTEIVPSSYALETQDFDAGRPIPKRVTQLTIQQAEVLWVGTWPLGEEEQPPLPPQPTPTPLPIQLEEQPDVVILSMPLQDAVALKWSLERGLDIDLGLRAPGDSTVYATTGVSLPQIVDQGGLAVPEPSDFDFHPRADEVPIPSLPPLPPEN